LQAEYRLLDSLKEQLLGQNGTAGRFDIEVR
jgi:hypothetical protein